MRAELERVKTVVVIGAGIAGLSAAYDLKKAGYAVTVLDADSHSGGRMADLDWDGLNVHSGATILWESWTGMMELVEELGLRDRMYYWYEDHGTITNNGTIEYEVSFDLAPLKLLSHPAIGLKSKVKLPNLLGDMLKASAKVDSTRMHTAAYADDGETIADYVKRRVGEDFLENIIEPLFRVPWSWEPENISKAYLIALMGSMRGKKRRIFSFVDGVGTLTRTLTQQLDVRLNHKVNGIVQAEGGDLRIQYECGGSDREIAADVAIVATQGNRAAALVQDLDGAERSFFDSVRYTSVGIVYYLLEKDPEFFERWYTRKSPSKFAFYVAFPRSDKMIPGESQPPHLYCELTPQVVQEVIANGDQGNLDKYARDQARAYCPTFDTDVIGVREQWIESMLPEWYPGYARKVSAFLEHQQNSKRPIYFAGDYLAHSYVGGACSSGRDVAERIIASQR
jgi:oxygen-dependent protoporphyrinogen oxidase